MKALSLNIAIGSIRPPKVEAVRTVLNQIAPLLEIQPNHVNYIAREVPSGVPMVPLSIHEIRRGAFNRAREVRRLLEEEYGPVDYAIGMEGGLFILSEENSERVHLQSWVYVERLGEGHYGSSMSMPIPSTMAHAVIEQKQDLSKVIDHYAGRQNVRNHDGAFGFLSRGFLDRQQAFELALLSAFAPFYHPQIYQSA
ncbi:MAG: inosine/xanthosine triphosphatase [candidate division KSB1 bacterium]